MVNTIPKPHHLLPHKNPKLFYFSGPGIWPSWCHFYSRSLASVKSRLILPFWYQLTRVVPEKGPLKVRVCASLSWEKPLLGIKIFLWLHFYSVNKEDVVIEAVSLIWSDLVSICSIICYLASSCRKKTVLPTENEAILHLLQPLRSL